MSAVRRNILTRWVVAMSTLALAATLLAVAPGAARASEHEVRLTRIDGGAQPDDVRAIAIQACQTLRPEAGSAARVLVTQDGAFADALAGAPLAGTDGCILFTQGGPEAPLDARVRAEIDRALPSGGQVDLLGGRQAVSQTVQDELAGAGYDVRRHSGASRYETAVTIANALLATRTEPAPFVEVILAFGENWPDAVTTGAYAAAQSTPIVLTQTGLLHPAAAAFLDAQPHIDRTTVVGGTAVISDQAADAAPSPQRFSGPNRMGTTAEVARALWPTAGMTGADYMFVNLEHDQGWAVALAGAPLAAAQGAPQFGVGNNRYPAESAAYFDEIGFDGFERVNGILMGDASFVTPGVAEQIRASLAGESGVGAAACQGEPSDPLLPEGAMNVREAQSDMSGDGQPDTITTYSLDVDGSPQYRLRVELANGFMDEAVMDASSMANVRPLGSSKIGPGRPVAFVVETVGASREGVSLWGLHAWDDDPCSLGRVTIADHTADLQFPVGATTGSSNGLACRDFDGDGVPNFVERTAREEPQGSGTWHWEEMASRWDGAGPLWGEDFTPASGTFQSPQDDAQIQEFSGISCPGVQYP